MELEKDSSATSNKKTTPLQRSVSMSNSFYNTLPPLECSYSMWDGEYVDSNNDIQEDMQAVQVTRPNYEFHTTSGDSVSFLCLNAAFLPTIGNIMKKFSRNHLKRERKRLRALVAIIKQADYDIVCLQEMWNHRIRERLYSMLNVQRYNNNNNSNTNNKSNNNTIADYQLGTKSAAYYSFSTEDIRKLTVFRASCGMLVLSKFPIVNADMQEFHTKSMGSDYFSLKGILHVELNVHGQPLHVATTHMQASPDPFPTWWPFMVKGNAKEQAKQVRQRQLEETKAAIIKLSEILTEKGKERTNLIFCGDLNIPRESAEYFEMMDTLYHPVDILGSFNKDALDEEGNSVMSGKLDYVLAWDQIKPIFDNRIVFETAQFVDFHKKFKNIVSFPISDHPGIEASFRIIPKEDIATPQQPTL